MAKDAANVGKISSTIAALFNEICSNVSNKFLRLAAWFLLKIFPNMFSSICCQTDDLITLKMAAKKNIPLIYLPLHKSHMDYIIVSFVLFCNNIRVPYTAAGDNLNGSALLGFMLNRLGAFFIRRKKIDKNGGDDLYNIVLQEYIETLLREKQSLQVFIEGTRSRTGKALPPKTGILSIITNAAMKGVVDDVLIVPVNISYEKIPECSTYSQEQLGAQKVPETAWQLISSLYKMLSSSNGQIHVGFGKPLSFDSFCSREEGFRLSENNASTLPSVLRSSFCNDETTMRITRNLASHVIDDCCNSAIITCTSMVSFLLVTKHRSGVAMEELEDSFDWLKEEIVLHNGYHGFTGATHEVVAYAVEMLLQQGCISISNQQPIDLHSHLYIMPATDAGRFLGLVFYSNQVLHLFFGKAIMASSIIGRMGGSSLVQVGQSSVDVISRIEVLSLAKSLSSLLIKECRLCPPCRDLEVMLSDVLDSFVASGVLTGIMCKTADELKNKNQAEEMTNWDDDYEDDYYGEIETDVQYEVNINEENRASLIHLNSIISPLLETYWLVTASLDAYVGENRVAENDLIQSLHKLALGRAAKGVTKYVETASLVTLKNAVATLRNMAILTQDNSQGKDNGSLRISSDFLDQERLEVFMHEINLCR